MIQGQKKVIVLIDTSRIFGRDIMRGIARYSRVHGPWIFYTELGKVEKAMPRPSLNSWGANGIIAHTRDKKIAREIISLGLPIVAATPLDDTENEYTIISDWHGTGQIAAEHLLERGFKNFAYCGQSKLRWSYGRGEGFSDKIKKAGYEVYFYDNLLWGIKKSGKEQLSHLAEWLVQLPKPLGVMAGNDDLGQYVLEACNIADLRVPDDVAVIGVDNDPLICDMTNPPLSSIIVDSERAGYEAAELLDRLMSGVKVPKTKIIVQPKQVESRQSTDILAIEDEDVRNAVRFIRDNCRKPLQVDQIAEYATISRRTLELKFCKYLGRSINQEIRHFRTEQICKMLIETTIPITHIAYTLGYPGINNLSRYFSKEKKMSPNEYRLKYGIK